MTAYRTVPNYTEPLVTNNNTSAAYYRWMQATENGIPPSGETVLTPSASPYIYTATRRGFVIVSGGTVSYLGFSRTPGTFYNTGQTAGSFPVNQGDQLSIVYSAAPTVVFVPS